MAHIEDFGEKIGGARKDIWKSRGLMLHDLDVMNDMERQSHIKKDNIWLKPDWVKLVSEGTPQCIAYWQNEMRKSIPLRPPEGDAQTQENYIQTVREIRDAVMSVKDPFQINTFYSDFLKPSYIQKSGYYDIVAPEARGIVTGKVMSTARTTYREMERKARKKLFGIPKTEQTYVSVKNRMEIYPFDNDRVRFETSYNEQSKCLGIKTTYGKKYVYIQESSSLFDESPETGTYLIIDDNSRKVLAMNIHTREEAEKRIEDMAISAQKSANEHSTAKPTSRSKRKTSFLPPQLQHIKRTGPNYRHMHDANGQMFLDDMQFRGGEFGNWLNENDRRTSLNMAYDSLRDLARILEIRPEDISLNHSLAIAFGARGRGNAAAHYETDRQVINLTKMSGAGCLAHEWAHALDHSIGRYCKAGDLASRRRPNGLPNSFTELIDTLKYKTITLEADEIDPQLREKINRAERNLLGWIAYVKPTNLTANSEELWTDTVDSIKNNVSSFSGSEYSSLGRPGAKTHPSIEMLSQLSKASTNHVIPKDTKRTICQWASILASHKAAAQNREHREAVVKTDFYNGSIKFDELFSKAGHGYFKSDCEMFARAFDCYISDKLKASGFRSDYLTAYADSFVLPGNNDKPIAAIPQGEERKRINDAFDKLIADLKSLGILHQYVETLDQEKSILVKKTLQKSHSSRTQAPDSSIRYEQMSFEQLLAHASNEQKNQSRTSSKQANERIR